ncbi:hypothetical protein AUQ39_04830 [Lacticaseibacillus casei]|nr:MULTISPECIES: hypothetical protein [Lacticaseibacillus]MDE3283912.1 hypothetical protein [Lacticaseibacillus casei]OLS09956.1 hypothetical protein AUQ39_04830 [Lacticaseibacillus casei]QVI31407.1 hypothetical protein KG087_10835 [Lacticaseibacillus zeae]TLF42177.1 hypothetical protein FEI14_07780 [Lacticaseibacillus zeae]
MDWVMRSDFALELGVVLYVIFEILALPLVSALTVYKKIGSMARGVIIFLSFILSVATPILVVTPLGEHLHVPDESLGIYISVLFAIMIMIPFIITLVIDLTMLHLLRNPQSKYHGQIEYFQSGGIVFLIQALLLLEWGFLFSLMSAIYTVITPPKQIEILSKALMVISWLAFPVVLIMLWKGVMGIIKKAGATN